MRILQYFMFIFIAATSSTSVADESILKKGESVPHLMHILGYMNTTLKDIENFDNEMCTKIGGPGTYDSHKKNWVHFMQCMAYVKNQVMEELLSSTFTSPLNRMESVDEKYCEKVSNVEHCFKNVTDSMKTCLDPDKHENADIMYKVISSMWQHVCKDGAIRLIEFEAAGGGECVDTNINGLLKCVNQTIAKYIKNTVPNGAAVGGLGALHLLSPDMEKCTVMDKFHRCSTEILQKQCRNQNTANLFDGLFNSIITTTTCDRILAKSRSSSVIYANAINGLLMLTVTSMLLLFA